LAFAILLATTFAALPSAADWREWLHPQPASPPKAPPPKQVAAVSAASESARDARVESFLRALADAIKARDGAAMVARLADNYAIDGLDGRAKPADLFMQAVERIPGPTEMIVESIERQGNAVTARTEFRYANTEAKKKVFRFDAAGRLVWSDLFAIRTQGS
jgi:hypothetical protein